MSYKTEANYFHKYLSSRVIYSFATTGGATFFHITAYPLSAKPTKWSNTLK